MRRTESDRPFKSVLDKLGVKPGQRVSALRVSDAAFLGLLRDRVGDVATARAAKGSDLVFYEAADVKALDRLAALEGVIARNGAIWVTWRKGQPSLNENHVRDAALRVGLVDVKVVAFSTTHSALKLVIPVARR